MLEALVFDVDGTVAETEDLHRRAFNLAFREHGVDLAWNASEYRRLLRIHGGKERLARALAMHDSPCSRDAVAALHASKTRHYGALLAAEGVAWRTGVRRVMDEATALGLKLALATTTTEANLQSLFAPSLGPAWRCRFGAIVAGDAVARKKPAPDVYVEVLRRLGIAAGAAVAFEDSTAGVESARRAGLAVIATPSRWLPGDDVGGAGLVLEHLGDADEPWTHDHPLLRMRWMSAKALAAWHAVRQDECMHRG